MSLKVAIIGGGNEGQSAMRYWLAEGAEVTLHDSAEGVVTPPHVEVVEGPGYLENLDVYDLVVRSPGVKPKDITTTARVTSVVREFFDKCPAPIIGITGTKGKGTTATLTAKILEKGGQKVWLGGNIGKPPLDFLSEVKSGDVVVLELSSFQLMDMDVSPHIAVCLMVTPEHLDWHSNLREYVAAKGNLFWHQQPDDIAIYNSANDYSTQIALLSPGHKVPFMKAPGAAVAGGNVVIGDQVVCPVAEVGLIGPHNLQNVCAAVTAAQQILGEDVGAAQVAVREFKGLEHRLEFVGRYTDISYIDDSFSTNPETAIAAIDSFAAPKVMILGGSEKNSKYQQLGPAVANGNVRAVVLVGQMAGRIRKALEAAGYKHFIDGGKTMAEMVAAARAAARPGDVVLLSPACASYDLFKNYKDRGDQFKAVVRKGGE